MAGWPAGLEINSITQALLKNQWAELGQINPRLPSELEFSNV